MPFGVRISRLAVVVALALSACDSSEGVCSGHSDCERGAICFQGKCIVLGGTGGAGIGGAGGLDCSAHCEENEPCLPNPATSHCCTCPADTLCSATMGICVFDEGTGGTGPGGAGGQGTGGAGGQGTGGSGGQGTGGSGGDDSQCGAVTCKQGETCISHGFTKRCECDPAAKACEAGLVCSPKSLQCEPSNRPKFPLELTFCEEGVEEDEEAENGLVCMLLSPGLGWIRPCETNKDCALLGTMCDSGICWYNGCGFEAESSPLHNGYIFGRCDADDGRYDESTTALGMCAPENESDGSLYALCERAGSSVTTCKGRKVGARGSDLCALGLHCAQLIYNTSFPCDDDGDCAKGLSCKDGTCAHVGCGKDSDCASNAYCSSDGICLPLGTCVDDCNAGAGGPTWAEFAGCAAGKTCVPTRTDLPIPPSDPVRPGVCID